MGRGRGGGRYGVAPAGGRAGGQGCGGVKRAGRMEPPCLHAGLLACPLGHESHPYCFGLGVLRGVRGVAPCAGCAPRWLIYRL